MRTFIDLTGYKFSFWTVLKKAEQKTLTGHLQWVCRCVCGVIKTIPRGNLRNGSSTNCGCMHIRTKHGHARRNAESGAYKSWMKMHHRIKHNPAYNHIQICKEWYDFENFYRDMGDRPEGLTIERVSNDGDYTPYNCVWATRLEQAQNRG